MRQTDVVIVGAGPAGLMVGNLLRAEGIDCVVLERQSREHVEQRARAGFLAPHSVRILTEHGLASGLHEHGRQHDTCAFRFDGEHFELKYSGLGSGEVHTVYPQQDLVRDLIAEFIARGDDIRFSTTVTSVDPLVITDDEGWESRFVAGCDGQLGVSRSAVPGERFQRNRSAGRGGLAASRLDHVLRRVVRSAGRRT